MHSITSRLHALVAVLLLTLVLAGSRLATAEEFTEPARLVEESAAVFKSFMSDKDMDWMRKNITRARGVLIVPQMLKGGFVVGASGGSGVLLVHDEKSGTWSYPAFYTMGSVSIGLQAGAEASEVILMLMTDKAVDSMLSTSVKLGGDVTLAAGPVGAGAKAQVADVLAYARSKGLFGGISLEGAVIKPRDSWNASFYGKEVRPVDILISRSVSNPAADPLRHALFGKLH